MKTTAKLFMNGRSQAVRLPRDFRFEGKEVQIRRDLATGDVILSPTPEATDPERSWQRFLASRQDLVVDEAFVRALERVHSDDKPDPFADWVE